MNGSGKPSGWWNRAAFNSFAKRGLLLGVLILILLAKVGIFKGVTWQMLGISSPLSALENPSTDVDTARTLISSRLSSAGGEETYKEFRGAVKSLGEKTQHFFAHAMGEALYAKEGDAGLSTCDSSFNFGCYHGFLGAAITAEGIAALPHFDEACKTLSDLAAVACQHGIGHGIVVYTSSDILRSLALCKTLTWYPEGGCRNGVYMEFNFRNFASLYGEDVRPLLASQGPYYPCSIVPAEFAPSCYSQQPYWWSQVLHTDYQHMGALCAGIADSRSQETCFEGVGKSAAIYAKYSATHTIEVCILMPNASGTAYCEEGASRLFAREQKPGVKDLCLAIPTPEQKRCIQNIQVFTPMDTSSSEDF